jgi:hypothetical protein
MTEFYLLVNCISPSRYFFLVFSLALHDLHTPEYVSYTADRGVHVYVP